MTVFDRTVGSRCLTWARPIVCLLYPFSFLPLGPLLFFLVVLAFWLADRRRVHRLVLLS